MLCFSRRETFLSRLEYFVDFSLFRFRLTFFLVVAASGGPLGSSSFVLSYLVSVCVLSLPFLLRPNILFREEGSDASILSNIHFGFVLCCRYLLYVYTCSQFLSLNLLVLHAEISALHALSLSLTRSHFCLCPNLFTAPSKNQF